MHRVLLILSLISINVLAQPKPIYECFSNAISEHKITIFQTSSDTYSAKYFDGLSDTQLKCDPLSGLTESYRNFLSCSSKEGRNEVLVSFYFENSSYLIGDLKESWGSVNGDWASDYWCR